MDGSGGVSRRTRSKWDEFYRNISAKKNVVDGGLKKKRRRFDVRGKDVCVIDLDDSAAESESESSSEDDYITTYKSSSSKSSSSSSSSEYSGSSKCNRSSSGDGIIMIDKKEFCRTKKTEDDIISIDKKQFFGTKKKKKKTGEKVVFPVKKKTGVKGFSFKKKKGEKKDRIRVIDENEFFSFKKESDDDDDDDDDEKSEKKLDDGKWKEEKVGGEDELMRILLDSINVADGQHFGVDKNAPPHTLPLRFRFEEEDEEEEVVEKSEWEEYIDSLFQELEMGLRQIHMEEEEEEEVEHLNENAEMKLETTTAAARCERGEHLSVLDEQIGILCKYCHHIIMDIKHVLPDFYKRPPSRRAWRESDAPPTSPVEFPGPDFRTPDSTTRVKGTVWDLVPGIEQGMFPHQREGLEFIWRNVAGDIVINNLNQNDSDSRGCIISHAPGTGKTRLTIAFLQTFLKQYPACCPMLIAPKSMLLNWESEFSKWNFDIPFHNLNMKGLSGKENAVAVSFWNGAGGVISRVASRILKMYSWIKDGGILCVSYALFVKLTGEKSAKEGRLHAKMREMLLQSSGLLVLDEGHTPRNEHSMIWKALMQVSTRRRIILSGTPFQNNMLELFNTLSLVNPEFVKQIGCEDQVVRKSWMKLTRSTGQSRDDGLRRLRAMLDPFVHVHKGSILEDRLPGLRHTVVFLHPTECQKKILEEASSKEKNVFRRTQLVSMASVHPSCKLAVERSNIEVDVDLGVKMKFLLKLVWLADALGERVLIFSQFLDPLTFIMKQIECHLSWRKGRELLYMDGQLDEKQRQDSISSFNDFTSEAKVLLASQRACSEGINLVGASRVVLLDTVWNPSMEKQATRRAYRLGQKKVVHVYRLLTSGVEVRQFAQQAKKVEISKLIFSDGDGETCRTENSSSSSSEDKLLEAMLNIEGFNAIFEKVICQPNESDLIDIFGLEN